MGCIHPAQDKDQCLALVHMEMNVWAQFAQSQVCCSASHQIQATCTHALIYSMNTKQCIHSMLFRSFLYDFLQNQTCIWVAMLQPMRTLCWNFMEISFLMYTLSKVLKQKPWTPPQPPLVQVLSVFTDLTILNRMHNGSAVVH